MEMLLSLSLSPLSEGEKRGVGLLPEGLVCTENDLAFLQHVETIQQHQRLQVVIDTTYICQLVNCATLLHALVPIEIANILS